MGSPLRRLAAVCLPALLLPAAALAAGSTHSWAQPQIKLVTKQGLFAGSPATFDASADLTQGALAGALGKLTNAPAAAPSDGVATVSIEQLDRSLVDALGLAGSAYRIRLAARDAGITPPRRFSRTGREQPCPHVFWHQLASARTRLSALLFPPVFESARGGTAASKPDRCSCRRGARSVALMRPVSHHYTMRYRRGN